MDDDSTPKKEWNPYGDLPEEVDPGTDTPEELQRRIAYLIRLEREIPYLQRFLNRERAVFRKAGIKVSLPPGLTWWEALYAKRGRGRKAAARPPANVLPFIKSPR